MAACEACWSKAYAIAVRTGQHQADVYRRLLADDRKQSTEAAGLHDCEYDDPRMCAWPGHRKAQS